MKTEAPLDFEKLIADMGSTREFLGVAAKQMHGDLRGHFDKVLVAIDENVEAFKEQFPKYQETVAEKYNELVTQNKAHKEQLATLKEQLQATIEKSESGELPEIEMPAERPVDQAKGRQLRDELLKRTLPPAQPEDEANGPAWQDWMLNGNWLDKGSSD